MHSSNAGTSLSVQKLRSSWKESNYKFKMQILLGILLIIICILLIIIFILAAHLPPRTTGNQNSQAVPTGTLVPLNSQKNDTTCPFDWHGYKGYCYKLSENEKNWFESQNACILHNASLAKITEEERGTMRMFTRDRIFWIGLKREPNQPWKWLDGENATWIKIMGNGGDCAFLDNDVTAMSVRCITEHHYMCKKNAPKRS